MFLSKKYFVVVFFKSYTCIIRISFLQRIWQFELISETSPKVMEDPMVNYFLLYHLQDKFLNCTGTFHAYIFLQVQCLIIHDGFDHPHQVNQ